MTHQEQLDAIIDGRIASATREAGVAWEQRHTVFTLPRSVFDEWADTIELPHRGVYAEALTWDGVYAVERGDLWHVFVQERGAPIYEHPEPFSDYRHAKREALALQFLHGLELT